MGVRELFPETEIAYVTMFPRNVERCCNKTGHMTDNDTVIMDNLRRDVDRDVVETQRDTSKKVRILEWWDILGLDSDKTINEVKRMRLIEGDGVHLSVRANRCAAVSLCIRMRETESETERCIKKQRLR
jgi:hypothetical protein